MIKVFGYKRLNKFCVLEEMVWQVSVFGFQWIVFR